MWQSEHISLSIVANSVNRCSNSLVEGIDTEKLFISNAMESITSVNEKLSKINVFTSYRESLDLGDVFPEVDENYLIMEPKRLAKSLARNEGVSAFGLIGCQIVKVVLILRIFIR